ncbi:MAG: hypothetical protein ABSC57_05040 [Syntrophales bacterium]
MGKVGSHFVKATVFVILLVGLDLMIGSILEKGLRQYFGMDGKVDILCIGHSRTVLGIDGEMLARGTGLKVAKYAVNGANIVDRYAMIRQFLSEHPEVRLIVYDVEASTFSGDGLSSNSYQLFFPFMDNPEMRAYLESQTQSRTDLLLKRMIRTSRFDEITFSLAMRGLFGMNENLKYGRFDEDRAKRWIEKGKNRPVKIDPKSYHAFLSTIDFVKSRGVAMLLVDMPTVNLLNQVEWPESEKVRDTFRHLKGQYPNIDYCNLSTVYQGNYEMFYDMLHLNAEGQKIVTARLAEKVNSDFEEEMLK